VLDHALENVLKHLRAIRRDQPTRPIILVPTTLHEAYPQQQHREPYPFDRDELPPADKVPADLLRSLQEQRQRFAGLYDHFVPIDLTPSAEALPTRTMAGRASKRCSSSRCRRRFDRR